MFLLTNKKKYLQIILSKVRYVQFSYHMPYLPFTSICPQGPVVQSIVSLTSSLRGQLLKCFVTLQPTTLKFFVDKIREAFAVALQKLLTFFSAKNIGKSKILTFEILTKR